jgi:DNA processing protein
MREASAAVHWIALRAAAGVGDMIGRRLIARFGHPRAALDATPEALTAAGFAAALARRLAAARRSVAAREQARRLAASGARLVGCTDDEYPRPLAELPDAPLYLVARGQALTPCPAVAIVGARRATPYGRDVAGALAEELAHAGLTVVSGLARGIDGAAHEGALRGSGLTVAVLGSGVDVIYPPEHRGLATRIEASGTVLSERPLGTAPLPAYFPARNRIIAGMTCGTVVVEAGQRSGALITARLANDCGREVFAVPGRIDSPVSVGPHRLMRDGATLVRDVDDILAELGPSLRGLVSPADGTRGSGPAVRDRDGDDPLLAHLAGGPLTLDRLAHESGLTPAEVLARALDLELRGCLRQQPGQRFALTRRPGP